MTADADQDGKEITLICDGTTWNAAGNAPIQFGDDQTSCISNIEGRIRYRSSGIVWQYCDGSAWVPFQQPRCTDYITGDCFINALSPDHSANDVDFIAANIKSGVNILGVVGTYTGSGSSTIPLFVDIDNLALSTVYESGIERINPPNGSAISIAGDGSPQYQICSDADCASVVQAWTSSAGTVDLGQYVQLRATSASSQNVTNTVTLSYAGSDALWNLKTTILNCLSTNTVTFDYTGSVQTLNVDNFSTECTYKVSIYGAGGGKSEGGAASFSFKPNTIGDFDILVGERGGTGGRAIAYGGGGGTVYSGPGGGGASAIKFETTLLAISGGGGGGQPTGGARAGGSLTRKIHEEAVRVA